MTARQLIKQYMASPKQGLVDRALARFSEDEQRVIRALYDGDVGANLSMLKRAGEPEARLRFLIRAMEREVEKSAKNEEKLG